MTIQQNGTHPGFIWHRGKSTLVADSVLAISAGIVVGKILGAHVEFHLT